MLFPTYIEVAVKVMQKHRTLQALSGVRLPGYKLVEGRSIRRITNVEAAALALNRAGYKTTEIYKPQELRTITDLEKLTGKKQFAAICGEYIEKPQGKPTR